MTTSSLEEYQQYRVPRAPGTVLVEPALPDLVCALAAPGTPFSAVELEFCGKSLEDVRQQARQEAVELAWNYTRQYADDSRLRQVSASDLENRPIVLSGHQPELFHAGVWFKNFLLGRLSQEARAISINFLVDNDLCRSTTVRVPTRDEQGNWVARQVAFDQPLAAVPWELRSLQSQTSWDAFPKQVNELLDSASIGRGSWTSLLGDLWPLATEALQRTGRLGMALAQARHQLELEDGLCNLEVPLSQLVATRAFARFSIGLLAELPRFQDVYNNQRAQYRRAHRIRNSAHPVPALEQEGGWLESPWWVYRAEAPQRQRLWVRLLDDQLILSDRAGWQRTIDGRLDCDQAASQWLEILAEGVCLRPRALLTTMYLRLLVADMFVHGIGGGKYDQLTNGILREFFDIDAPPMAVATATLHLPNAAAEQLDQASELQARIEELEQKQWAWKYHAEQMAAELPEEAASLIKEKHQLLANIPPKGEKWEWHQAITSVNSRLRELASERIESTRQELDELHAQLRQAQLIESREFSFCLYPREVIVPQLKQLSGFTG